jgi:hypothetical protein
MGLIKFTETVFSDKNKKGILTPDENGYYEVILGALNVYNSAGEYYVADGAVELFKNSSVLMRRINGGALYSELGHPKKPSGMSHEEFYRRIIALDENNICAHISEISLDLDYGRNNPEFNNPDMIAIIGKVKPSGAKASAVESSLTNPKENTAFSIRALTENTYKNGRVEKTLTNVITWDYVIEPGIAAAKKSFSPSLESIDVIETLEMVVDTDLMSNLKNGELASLATEDSQVVYEDIMKTMTKISTVNKLRAW